MSEDENIIVVLKSKECERTSEYLTARLKKIEKCKTSFDDDVLKMWFESKEGKEFFSTYPLDKGPRGKLAHFMTTARKYLDLEPSADIDVNLLIDKELVYERVHHRFVANGGRTVKYYYFVLAHKGKQPKGE